MPTSRTAPDWLPAAAAVAVAGWGAHQFTPLTTVYRAQAHWSAVSISAMFSTYLLGLVPGLLLGGRVSDRYGRRRVVRSALGLSAAASAVLALAEVSPISVYAGRLATGVTVGLVFAAGTLRLRELSAEPDGARRAMYATGGGFAAGALAAGAIAEWLPLPMVVPSLAHALLTPCVLGMTRRVPETAPPYTPGAAGNVPLPPRRAALLPVHAHRPSGEPCGLRRRHRGLRRATPARGSPSTRPRTSVQRPGGGVDPHHRCRRPAPRRPHRRHGQRSGHARGRGHRHRSNAWRRHPSGPRRRPCIRAPHPAASSHRCCSPSPRTPPPTLPCWRPWQP